MLIKITQEHIDLGTPRTRNQTFSPLSFAICQATGVLWNVDYDCCYPCGFRSSLMVKLPPEARKWMEDYDYGRPVKPAEFEIDLPNTSHITARIPWEEVVEILKMTASDMPHDYCI